MTLRDLLNNSYVLNKDVQNIPKGSIVSIRRTFANGREVEVILISSLATLPSSVVVGQHIFRCRQSALSLQNLEIIEEYTRYSTILPIYDEEGIFQSENALIYINLEDGEIKFSLTALALLQIKEKDSVSFFTTNYGGVCIAKDNKGEGQYSIENKSIKDSELAHSLYHYYDTPNNQFEPVYLDLSFRKKIFKDIGVGFEAGLSYLCENFPKNLEKTKITPTQNTGFQIEELSDEEAEQMLLEEELAWESVRSGVVSPF
mgnify:CR=1 FL=1